MTSEAQIQALEAELEQIANQRMDRMSGIEALAGKRTEQERANIPLIYRDAHLGNFRTPIYTDQNKVRLMNKIISTWYKDFETNYKKGKGLYIWSETKGSGKTRMAISLLNEILVEHRIFGYFATSTQIINEIKNTWDDDTTSESELLWKLTRYHVLIIDDFGTELPKQWINERFYHIINERYNNQKLTIYTSNHNLESLRYDDRIIDRIFESTFVVPMPEESIRRKLAKVEQERITNE